MDPSSKSDIPSITWDSKVKPWQTNQDMVSKKRKTSRAIKNKIQTEEYTGFEK